MRIAAGQKAVPRRIADPPDARDADRRDGGVSFGHLPRITYDRILSRDIPRRNSIPHAFSITMNVPHDDRYAPPVHSDKAAKNAQFSAEPVP